MIYPKGKGQNTISSYSLAGEYIPACWLANPNIHWFLVPGQILTPALTKSLSLIFLWADFSWRAHIPVINPLLKTVCVFGGWWVAHSYSASPQYNNITNNFLDRIPLLVLTCWQCDDKLNVGFQKMIDECSFFNIWLSLTCVLYYLLTNKYQMKVSYAENIDYYYLVLSNSCFDKNWTVLFIYFLAWFENCEINYEKWHIRNI